jgi:hypothetical protein
MEFKNIHQKIKKAILEIIEVASELEATPICVNQNVLEFGQRV